MESNAISLPPNTLYYYYLCPTCNLSRAVVEDQHRYHTRKCIHRLAIHIEQLKSHTDCHPRLREAIQGLQVLLNLNRPFLNADNALLYVGRLFTSYVASLLNVVFFNESLPSFTFDWMNPFDVPRIRQQLPNVPEQSAYGVAIHTRPYQVYVHPTLFVQRPRSGHYGCAERDARGLHRISTILHEMLHLWLRHWIGYDEVYLKESHGLGFVILACRLEKAGSVLLRDALGGNLRLASWAMATMERTPLEEDDDEDDGSCEPCKEIKRLMRIGGLEVRILRG